ncbi:MAG: GNAT family N-acetyltransferase [Chloroflexota bacterium]|nr:GNAT family N-acetyltransferase [Chloroflexota bacterium]
MLMPTLETARLLVRPFTLDDLDALHRILDIELSEADVGDGGPRQYAERREWLQWTVLSYGELAKLYQPPYGDRAVVLKDTNLLIGACGYAPALNAFGQLPSYGLDSTATGLASPEFGLYYAISPAQQRRRYAAEAAQALVDYAFGELRLRRIVATTSYDNVGSMGVMRRLGMRIERNPYPDPPWLQVVGILDHPALGAAEA